ncbi:hypothetical protein BSKO_12732 [Bryopsis sp. KO-2023]|nr:hypothetical protein BSKO_12732 [Bryopsis sp. KO-2023]
MGDEWGARDCQVLGRIEGLPDWRVKRLFRAIYLGVFLGAISLVILSTLKFTQSLESFDKLRVFLRTNVVVGTLCAGATVGCLIAYLIRIFQVRRARAQWTARRIRVQILLFVELFSHSINTICYVAPNVHVLGDACRQGGWLVQWCSFSRIISWNNIFLVFTLRARTANLWLDKAGNPVGRQDATLMDAPWHSHWVSLLVWLSGTALALHELIFVYSFGYEHHLGRLKDANSDSPQGLDNCEFLAQEACRPPTSVVVNGVMQIIQLLSLHGLAVFYIYTGYRRLQSKPYNAFRWTNIALRFHYLESRVIGNFLIFTVSLLWFVRIRSCSSTILVWYGILPSQLGMTIMVVVNCILFMPYTPSRNVERRSAENHLAWTENQKSELMVADGGKRKGGLFCFETALLTWYWSLCSYHYDSNKGECFRKGYPALKLEDAKKMYGLQHHDYIRIKELDTNVLISWNHNTIVLAFRGTDSLTNLWADVQFWRSIHPPERGRWLLGTMPLVHNGFLESWTASGVNHVVLDRLRGIIESPKFDRGDLRVIVTGHSLGGAVAVLASYDIVKYCGVESDSISCYTFGAPRVGNHAFVKCYNSVVPDTWQIINDHDIVPRLAKFMIFFKHVGRKVIINSGGDMIICPLFMEVSLSTCFKWVTRSSMVAQHFMLSYRKSMAAIIKAQFKRGKEIAGGFEAMSSLLFGNYGEKSHLAWALDFDIDGLTPA